MNFSLIICTYQRAASLVQLLQTVALQTVYPNQILVVDGSTNDETTLALEKENFKNVSYISVNAADRGLTKQRNIGILNVHPTSEIVCFLDDDTLLSPTYFENLLQTYKKYPDALGVGGYITNEVTWSSNKNDFKNYYAFDGFYRAESARFRFRKLLGLVDDTPPGIMPIFSHGRSIGHLPPSNKTYPVEFFMGCAMSFKKEGVDKIQFSTYFEGYGLYEDMDFCLRLSKLGKLYVNTAAQLEHHHHEAGRPNKFAYGKMVVRNGWYVWRVKYPKPRLKARLLFHLNVIVLLKLRFLNAITGSAKKQAFTEACGRLVGWLTLFFKAPK